MLPVRPQLTAAAFNRDMPPAVTESAREFPCPQCSENVPTERIAVVEQVSLFDTRINDPAFLDHVRSCAAHSLIKPLLEAGFITMETGKDDPHNMTRQIIAKLGVVSPKIVATLEERALEAGRKLAAAVVQDAATKIRNWGSEYDDGFGSLGKDTSIRLLQEALRAK